MNRSISLLFAFALLPLPPSVAAAGAGTEPLHHRLPVEINAERDRLVRQAAEMDRDGDGYISAEERRAWHQARRAERAAQGAKVSVEEWVERRLARLEAMDANKDGRVDAEEWRAHHPARGHGRHRGEAKGRGKAFRLD